MRNESTREKKGYINEIKYKIRQCILEGKHNIDEILPRLSATDPRLANNLIKSIRWSAVSSEDNIYNEKARNESAYLPYNLPAADPLRSQWWFTLNSVVSLSRIVFEHSSGKSVAFIGAPTVGYHFANSNPKQKTTIMDVDEGIVDSLDKLVASRKLINTVSVRRYDVVNPLPNDLKNKYNVVFIDPPWYPDDIFLFIARATELINNEGYIISIVPPRLTRPNIIRQRNDLISELIHRKYKIISLETDEVLYRVPDFEAVAFKDIKGFSTKPWRSGDVLIFKVTPDTRIECPLPKQIREVKVFSRESTKMRLFQFVGKKNDRLNKSVHEIIKFENNVSTRKVSIENVCIWSSLKKAVCVKQSDIARDVLSCWKLGIDIDSTVNQIGKKYNERAAKIYVNGLNKCFGLWLSREEKVIRRSPQKMLEMEGLSDKAIVKPSKEPPYRSDNFRTQFQRERDRVLWSNSFRKLANKCQVFNPGDDDIIRNRLSHSIEVMQLALTIASSFGLNRDLVEAGALVHDIGHAPFGHAGENALNNVMNEFAGIRAGGFNHYEHGVDVVRYLEDVYRLPASGGYRGLGLSKEILECIMKHTFSLKGRNSSSQSEVLKKSKHRDIISNDKPHNEAQAVRIADKISYLISDLEDGIKMGVIRVEHLMGCRFFHNPPIDIGVENNGNILEHFISQRRAILQVLMENVLNETERRFSLGKLNKYDYTIDHSEIISEELSEIWQKLQKGILHRHHYVVELSMKATQIIYRLILLFISCPELMDFKFRESHDSLKNDGYGNKYLKKISTNKIYIPQKDIHHFYYDKIIDKKIKKHKGRSIYDYWALIRAKDYVANLTDKQALAEYQKYFVLKDK